MSEKVQCPNCLELAEKVGNKITCQACDSVLEIKRTGGATVSEIGWKEQLEGRVKALEDKDAEPGEPEPSDDDLRGIEDEDQDEPIISG